MAGAILRKEIHDLDLEERQILNDAFEGTMSMSGAKGYEELAGRHALPGPGFGPRESTSFLPWHRMNLVSFEQAFRFLAPDATLVYWDWTSERARGEGLPEQFTAISYDDVDGGSWLNSLYRGEIRALSEHTKREPGPLSELQAACDGVQAALGESEFEPFSRRLEAACDRFRGWVGGHMKGFDYAAFDPLFWCHHANVDRIFSEWQQAHPDAVVPDAPLPPFDVRIADTLDVTHLGYGYAKALANSSS